MVRLLHYIRNDSANVSKEKQSNRNGIYFVITRLKAEVISYGLD